MMTSYGIPASLFQQVLWSQHGGPEKIEHWPPSGMQACRPALATEVKGVKNANYDQ